MDSTAPTRLHSIKLWPPSQSTRKVLVDRIIKNLTTPSILSRKYGLLSKEEAEQEAKQIESAAFAIANQQFEKEPDGDGGSAVQTYAKESSTLMVEVVKRGPRSKEESEAVYEPVAAEESTKPVAAEESTKPVAAEENTFFDISGGTRAFIKADEAQELFQPLQEPGNKYTKICFSNRSFKLDAAHVAAPILSSLKDQLTEVDLSDIVAGIPEEEALEVMKLFSSALKDAELRYLNLSDNALGEKGLRAFGELLKSQGNLEELYLINDGISIEAAKAVSELLPSTQRLKTLHFHNNMTGDEGAIVIAELLTKCPVLEDFRCSSTRVNFEGGAALAKALGKCPHLKKIDIRDNMFGVEAGIALSDVISVFTNLTEIYLSELLLENEGTLALVNALKDSTSSLEVLEMGGNEITADAAPALAALLLAKKESITKIVLSENELKDDGAIVIASALSEDLPRLTQVDLSSNMIRRAGARALSQAVVSKPGFKKLNINGNFISDEGVVDVMELFKNSPDLLEPLDQNDPEGEEYDEEEAEEDGDDNDDKLESQLKGLDLE